MGRRSRVLAFCYSYTMLSYSYIALFVFVESLAVNLFTFFSSLFFFSFLFFFSGWGEPSI